MLFLRRNMRLRLPLAAGATYIAYDSYAKRLGRRARFPVADINPDWPDVFDPDDVHFRMAPAAEMAGEGPNPWRSGEPIPIGRHGKIPHVLFRGDNRPPNVIFDESKNRYNGKTNQITGPGGFRAAGADDEATFEMFTHLMHQQSNTKDAVSFSKYAYSAASFGEYLYAIEASDIRDAVDYNDFLPRAENAYGNQYEVASRLGVPSEAVIMSAKVVWDQPPHLGDRDARRYVDQMLAQSTDRETWREKFKAHQAAAAALDLADVRLRANAPLLNPFDREGDV